jgi:outer membrane immunogenic protein
MKYKVLFFSPLGLIPAGQSAFAADMPVKARPPQAIQTDPGWAGFYAGAHLGAIFDHSKQTGFLPFGGGNDHYCWGGASTSTCDFSHSQTAVGVIGGGQIGYNFQSGRWVYGPEIDFSGTSARKTVSGANSTIINSAFGNWTAKTGVEAIGTARLRVGYAFDQALVYATGGLAVADMVNTFQASDRTSGGAYSWSGTGWRAGWTVGGGVEYKLQRNWSVKGEALYYDLGDKDHISGHLLSNGGIGAVFAVTDRMTGVIARVGINYLFH